ncbi:MAG: hypothetical protein QNJ46_31985 [Leptolyngbyaceae cyanobacterium MO_188.B28]|nr:hypothetical protein [Leptolyngbyaceae cyanobacterium MO_188.B28]
MHLDVPSPPFDGVGDSGVGVYYGKTGFDTFSHQKVALRKLFWLEVDPLSALQRKLGLIKKIILA